VSSVEFRKWWLQFHRKWGSKRINAMAWLLAIGLSAFVIHLLFLWNLHQSALLYMLVPYSISCGLVWFRSYNTPKDVHQRFGKHIVSALILMFATSIVLREGFVCVVMFMPIYLFFVIIGYCFAVFGTRSKQTRKYSTVVPLIVVLVSLEGTSDVLTLPTDTYIEVSAVSSLSVTQIKLNLAKPFNLQKKRHWLISIFPMPYHIDAGSLSAGDVHKIYTRYHRWFIGNTHEGQADLLIKNVSNTRITTEILNDSTYFSNYLKVKGTEINLTSLVGGNTKIRLRIDFERQLSPAWYYQPLQKYAVRKMADLLIKEVMIRET